MQRAWALFLFLPTFAQPTVDWSTYLGSPAQDELRATAIASDGSIVVVGWSLGVSFPVVNAWQGQNQGREDAVIVKFSSSGSLLWSTYLGGSDNDRALGVAVDSGGRIYVVGVTASSDFPVANAFQSTKAAGSDAFIACFSVDGRRLWATYYGGNGEDGATAVAVDAQGLLDVAGYTSSANFPVTTNAVQNRLAGYTDAFVLQLRPDGARVWATYFGGSGPDYATAICVDDRRNIYICGETSSSNFPLRNAFQQVLRGGTDAFVASFGPFGVWGWSTYYGGTENDRALGIAVTPERWVTVVGMTASQNLQVTPVWQLQYAGGGADGFVVQFSASGGLRWATFLGGGENDVATSCAVDPLGNLYVAGRTASSNFPQIGVGQRSTEGDDCFLLKLHRQGMPQWSLLLGGSASDAALGIAVDSAGNVALVGSTTSTDVSLGPPSYQSTLAGLADGLLVRLSGYLLSLELEVAIDTVLCTGDSLLVRWRVRGGEFGANNMFRVELSDAGGSFQVPLVLDSVVARRDTALRVFVPFQPPGGQYRIRVSASQPIAYSNDNGRLLSAQQRPQEPQLEMDGDTVFCEGRQVVLYVLQPQPGVRYRWWRDSIVVAEDATAYAASQSGRYSVEAYNACGSVRGRRSVTLTMRPLPRRPKILPEGGLRLCRGDTVELRIAGEVGVTFQWFRNDTALPRAQDTVLRVWQGGRYTVEARNACGVVRSLNSVHVTVVLRPPKPIIGQRGDTLVSSALTGNQWLDENKQPIPGATGREFVPLRDGIYYVQVTVDSCSSISDPYRFVRTSVEEVGLLWWRLEPNPATEVVWLLVEGGRGVAVEVVDPLGRCVYRESLRGRERIGINLHGWAPGVYGVRVHLGRRVETRLFVKR